jgi:hypothetical protein
MALAVDDLLEPSALSTRCPGVCSVKKRQRAASHCPCVCASHLSSVFCLVVICLAQSD